MKGGFMVGDKERLVVDTSVFIENLDVVESLMQSYDIYIPYVVLQELDHLKDKNNYNARVAIKFINNNYNKINFVETLHSIENNDDLIIETAKKNKCSIATYDICMKVKAKATGLNIIEINKSKNENQHLGYKIIVMTDEEMADFYVNMKNKWNVLTNEYLLIQNKDGEVIDKYKWCGTEFEIVKYKTINNKFMGKAKPLNIQQELLFDMLQDNKSKIKLTTGKFGTGKDYVMLAHAINQIESGKFDRLVWVRNNIEVANTKEIGFLPGSMGDKIMPYAQIIADHVGGQFGLEMMVRDGKIELQHMGFIRGRDIKNSIVYVSEAENMTKELVQLVMGRVSEGSVLYMNGDLKQVDKDIFRQNSGIQAMVNNLRGHENFGYIRLEKSERSEIARMADLLD